MLTTRHKTWDIRGVGSFLLGFVLLFSSYYLLARFGLRLDAVSGFASLVWVPTGLALFALLRFGIWLWPAIFLGAVLANHASGAPLFASFAIGVGNTLEAVFAAYLLRSIKGFRSSLDRLSDVLWLILIAAILSTIISATIGVSSLFFTNVVERGELIPTWIAWWVGDMMSNLIFAPLFLVWSARRRSRLTFKGVLDTEIIGFLILMVGAVIFLDLLEIGESNFPILYAVFPPLIWATVKFGQLGAVTFTFLMWAIAVVGTIQNAGPFASDSLSKSLLYLQAFTLVTASTTLVLGAVDSERKEAERRKDNFISVASHELKTPITTIKSYAQLMVKLFENKKTTKGYMYAVRLNEQTTRLSRLVGDLLDVSKIQMERLELEKGVLNVDEFVKNIANDMQQTTKAHQIVVEGKAGISILADEYRLGQVFSNLISNAIKFSPRADKVILRVHAHKNTCTLSVVDFGIGIAQKDLGKVFGRFFQVSNKIRPSYGGLGLGLYISQEIVRRHGGKITVVSEKGKGSEFRVSLPIGRGAR